MITSTSRNLLLAFGFLAALLASCDQIVYAPGELGAKRRFEAAASGRHRIQLIASVGPPTAEFVRQVGGEYSTASSTIEAMTLARHVKGFTEPRVLAYIDGTVLAYFAIDAQGNVVRHRIDVS